LVVTFRLAAYETPLWATPNFSSGRYNDAGDGCTQYLSLHPMTPWAEVLRNQDRRTCDRALLLRAPLWAVKVELSEDPLEISFENAASLGLEPDDLVADDQSRCRDLARRFRADPDAPRTLAVPSAALPGTTNLVLLDPYVAASYQLVPIAPEDLPVAMAAQDGRCPEGLWDLVHYRDTPTPHPALAAWQDGEEELQFEEPSIDVDAITAG
jgi:RES domain-containing protein